MNGKSTTVSESVTIFVLNATPRRSQVMESGKMEKRVRCSKCKKDKVRRYMLCAKSKRSVLVDQKRRRWNGDVCPQCRHKKGFYKKQAERDAERRALDLLRLRNKSECLGPDAPLYPPKLKSCITCGDKTHNYYRCATCNGKFLFGKSGPHSGRR